MSQRTILETVAIAQGKQVLLWGKAAPSTSQRLKQPRPPGKQDGNALLQCQAPIPELSALTQASNTTHIAASSL